MNKLIFFVALFLCVGIWGCEDKEDTKTCSDYTQQEKSKKYEWFIDSFGDEEGAGIIKQAQHFKVSKVDREKGTYYYQPNDGFVGSDSVEIEVSKGSDGVSRGYITIYKIKFEVTECGLKATVKEYPKHNCCVELYGEVGVKDNYVEEGIIVYSKEYEEFVIKSNAEELRLFCPPLEDEFCQEGLKVKIEGQLFEGTDDEMLKQTAPRVARIRNYTITKLN